MPHKKLVKDIVRDTGQTVRGHRSKKKVIKKLTRGDPWLLFFCFIIFNSYYRTAIPFNFVFKYGPWYLAGTFMDIRNSVAYRPRGDFILCKCGGGRWTRPDNCDRCNRRTPTKVLVSFQFEFRWVIEDDSIKFNIGNAVDWMWK